MRPAHVLSLGASHRWAALETESYTLALLGMRRVLLGRRVSDFFPSLASRV